MKLFRLGGKPAEPVTETSVFEDRSRHRFRKLPSHSTIAETGAGTQSLNGSPNQNLPKAIDIVTTAEAADSAFQQARGTSDDTTRYRLLDRIELSDLEGDFQNIIFHGCTVTGTVKGAFKGCVFMMTGFDECQVEAQFEECSFIGSAFFGCQIISFDAGSWNTDSKNLFIRSRFTHSIHLKTKDNEEKYADSNAKFITIESPKKGNDKTFISIPTRFGFGSFIGSCMFDSSFQGIQNLEKEGQRPDLWFDNATLFQCKIRNLPSSEVMNRKAVKNAFPSSREIGNFNNQLPTSEIHNIDLINTTAIKSSFALSSNDFFAVESNLFESEITLFDTPSVYLNDSCMIDCGISVLGNQELDLSNSCLHGSYSSNINKIQSGMEFLRVSAEDFKRHFQSIYQLLTSAESPARLIEWYSPELAGRLTSQAFSDDLEANLDRALEEGRTPGACWLRLERNGLSLQHQSPKVKRSLANQICDEATLRELVSEQSSLRLAKADLTGADLSWIDLTLTDLSHVIMDRASLNGADLRGAILCSPEGEPARMNEARLVGARLAGALLDEASFAGAALANATFSEDYGGQRLLASVRRANFSDATGLIGTEFTGLDLSGVKLPEEIKDFGALATIHTLSDQARNILLVQFLAAIYVVLTLLNLMQSAETTTITLPVLDVDAPRQIFGISAGLILVATFAYLHSKLARIWVEVGRLPSMFPDQRSAGRHIYPFILTSIVDWLRPSPRNTKSQGSRSGLINALIERTGALLTGWLMVPATLLAMLFLDNSGTDRDTQILRVLLGLSLFIAFTSLTNAFLKLRRTRNRNVR